MTITKTYRWGGKLRTKTVLVDPDSKPLAVEELAKNINDYFWYRVRCPKAPRGRSFMSSPVAGLSFRMMGFRKNRLAVDPPNTFR
jgi:hypothetical protein